jgi:hypothetical protein
MTDFYSQKTFLRLKEMLKDNPSSSIIPFIGAGLSIYGNPNERLPTWRQLIELLKETAINLNLLNKLQLNAIQSLLEAGYFQYAAEIITEAMPNAEIRRVFHESFITNTKTVPPAIQKLIDIPWKLIITTNYDNFIENNWKYGYIPILTSNDLKDVIYLAGGNNQKPHLLKIHGTIDRLDTWIFTDSQYDKLVVNNSAYSDFLKILLSRSILFIGFGLKDRDFNPLLEEMLANYPSGFGNHFALIDNKNKILPHVQQMIQAGIQPIYYESDSNKYLEKDCGHGEVISFIEELMAEENKISELSKEISVNYLMEPVADVNQEEIKIVISNSLKNLKYDQNEIVRRTDSLLYLLGRNKLVSRLAIIAFIEHQDQFYPHATVEISIKNETESTEKIIKIGGTVITQPEKIFITIENEFLLRSTNFKSISIGLRELIVNAINHRKYNIYRPIKINITNSSIIISNPGSFGIPIDNIWKSHHSVARNPELAMLMFEFKYAEMLGSGLGRVAMTFKNSNYPLPIIESENDETRVIVSLKRRKTKK